MYATRTATKDERQQMSGGGWLGHSVIGYALDRNGKLYVKVESDSEVRAVQEPNVIAIRRRMPDGKYIYRWILSR